MVCDSWVDRCASCSPPVSDNLTVKALQRGFQAEAVMADRAYDNTDLRQAIAEMDAQAVISSTHSRKVPILHNQSMYKERNRIERCFNKLKHFRRFGYDLREIHYMGFIHLAAIMLGMR